MSTQKKRSFLGFTEIAPDTYQSDVDPETVMSGRQLIGSLACTLGIFFSVIGTFFGCCMRVNQEIQKRSNKPAPIVVSEKPQFPTNVIQKITIQQQHIRSGK